MLRKKYVPANEKRFIAKEIHKAIMNRPIVINKLLKVRTKKKLIEF